MVCGCVMDSGWFEVVFWPIVVSRSGKRKVCSVFSVPLWCALVVLLSIAIACGKTTDDGVGVLRVGIEDHPKTLDPRYATDAYGSRITHQLIFSCLVQHGYDLQIVPDLAKSWETPDDKTYVFHLRPDVTFHDGTPLTADDVKFTFEHLMDPETGSPYAMTFKDKIKGIEVVDAHTIRFDLTQPIASFLPSLVIPILPKHVILNEDNFDERFIGSGPFRFASQSTNEIALVANKAYYGGPPKVDRVVFKVVSDGTTRYLKMKKGDLDLVVNAIPTGKIDEFKTPPLSDRYRFKESPGISYNYLAFNLEDEKLKDVRVRRAIALAINTNEIIQYKLHGHATLATGLLSHLNWYYEGDVPRYAHDPQKAKALLNEAQYTDPDGDGPQMRMSLSLKTANDPEVIGIARVIQAQLAEVGIGLDIRSYEWGTFYGDIKKGNFQMTSMRWVGVTEPDFYYDLFHSSQVPPHGRNRCRYQNKEMDQLVEKGRHTLDPKERKHIYSKVQKKIAEDLPYVSLWHLNNISIVNKRVNGYRQHPMGGFHSFKDIRLE